METLPTVPRQDQSWQSISTIIDAQSRVRHLGQELRHEFDAIAHEPLPREFLDLLDKLDRKSEQPTQKPEQAS
jgi:hypothetical protein